jgi:membrane protein YqaA with SNARE-associated domain
VPAGAVGDALGILAVGVASALVPLINIEVYLIGLAAVSSGSHVWFLAAVGGLGQMLGKLVWYHLGANALRWGWVRRKVEKPKAAAKLELWRRRTNDRPVFGAALLFVSAVSGFPPFAIIAVLAGQLRLNVWMFLVVGFVGRTLRFAGFLGGADWLMELGGRWF